MVVGRWLRYNCLNFNARTTLIGEKAVPLPLRIGVNGKEFSLGYFNNIEDAVIARRDGERKYWGINV